MNIFTSNIDEIVSVADDALYIGFTASSSTTGSNVNLREFYTGPQGGYPRKHFIALLLSLKKLTN